MSSSPVAAVAFTAGLDSDLGVLSASDSDDKIGWYENDGNSMPPPPSKPARVWTSASARTVPAGRGSCMGKKIGRAVYQDI